MKEFIAKTNDEGVRLSRFVQRVTAGLPSSLLYKSFRNKRIKINGKRAEADYRLQAGDIVQLYINDEFFTDSHDSSPTNSFTTKPMAHAPYETVWQNSELAFLYKPAGVLSHSDAVNTPNLLDSFRHALQAAGAYNPANANGFAPSLCNRLDRGTEGLVIAAKTYAALRDMNSLIKLGLVQKQYLCITLGKPPQGKHNAYHKRDLTAKTVKIYKNEATGTKPICTEVEVLEQHENLCLCLITLHTGRTHQIRAHLAHLGTPIIGDRKYGGQRDSFGLHTQALCAYRLKFSETLPPSNTLAYFAGKTFQCPHSDVQNTWQEIRDTVLE